MLALRSSCEGGGLQAVPSGFPNDTQLLDLRRNRFPVVPQAAFRAWAARVAASAACRPHGGWGGRLAGLGSPVLYLSGQQLSGLSAAALKTPFQATCTWAGHFVRVPGAALLALPSLFSLHLQDAPLDHLAPR